MMKDATSQLRQLRKKAEKINTTLLGDLKPFLGTSLFRRLPNSNLVGNATTTCSCLMALATSDHPLQMFKDLFETDEEDARERVTSMFEGIVSGTWTSSGLLDGNAFSSLLILRTAGLLSKTREALLLRSALSMNHTFKPATEPVEQTDVARHFYVGQIQSLRELILTFAKKAPAIFSVEDYPPTSAIAYWFVDAVEHLEVNVAKEYWWPIISWVSKNFSRQVSLATSHHDALKDPIEMAMAACLAQRLKRLAANQNIELDDDLQQSQPTSIELQDAILRSFTYQHKSGIWPKYFPLFNYRVGGAGSNYLYSFELLEVIIEEFGNSGLIEERTVLEGIEMALSWCESNRLTYKYEGIYFQGWNSGGVITSLSEGKPESWATAMVHLFLYKLRSTLSVIINRRVLRKYGATPDVAKKNLRPWTKFIDSPLELKSEKIGVKDLIQRELLDQIEAPNFSSQNKILGRRSALLFGPPGTSKTSLVRATATKMGWPLVELNPSHFLRRGLENVYSQAEEIFDDLNDLSWAVVFFDEMDALAQRRETGLDVVRQLLTTSLLPKLSKLHDEARVLFFMATNHQKDFDPAIKRPGRFDLLVCMIPPLFGNKLGSLHMFLPKEESPEDIEFVKERLKKWVSPDTPDNGVVGRLKALVTSHDDLVKVIDLFTFDEFRSFLEQIGKRSGTIKAAFKEMTRSEFVEYVNEWAKNYVSLNQEDAKEEFENDKQASRIQ